MSPNEPEEKMSEQKNPEQPEQKEPEQTTSEQVGTEQTAPVAVETEHVSQEPGEYELEESIDEVEHRSYSQGALVRRRFLHHKGAMVASVVLILVILLAFSSSIWWPKNHVDLYPLAKANGAPTFQLWPFSLGENPFGQNTIGKDYFALVMQGTQKSVIIAFVVGIIATAIGTIVGSAAGYFRGRVESILMRGTDLVLIIPLLVLAAVLGRMVDGANIYILACVLGVVQWTGMARLVRGEVLSLREREFVHAAKAIGTSDWRIIFRHILPNCIGTIVVNSTLLIASAILLETALSYLGFGVRSPETSLGLLISENQAAMGTRPWLFWWPGLFILVIALCVNFIGDGLRDAFDPRQQMD
jgi:ABC-type dipeptide/oligopeptide/nickel transport system, permease component